MIYLNFQNVEELIFNNKEVQNLLPIDFFNYFEQWRLAQRFPMLKQVGKSAILDFLNGLKDEQADILSDYFEERVVVEKLYYNLSQNRTISLSEENVCDFLCDFQGFNYFTTSRDKENLHITFWR